MIVAAVYYFLAVLITIDFIALKINKVQILRAKKGDGERDCRNGIFSPERGKE